MRIVALIFGIIGGLWGLFGAILLLVFGGFALGEYTFDEGVGLALGGGTVGVIIALIGIIGAVLAIKKPLTAGVMMILSGILGFLAIDIFYVVGGPILIIAGILAFVGRRKSQPVIKVKAVPIEDEPDEIVVEPRDITEVPKLH